MALVATLAGRAADRIISRIGRVLFVRKVFVCAGFCAGSSIVLLLFVRSQYAVLATLTCSLLGIGLASANYWALTQAVTPARIIGRVIGYQNTIANAAGICAPILTGYLLGDGKDFSSSIACAAGSLLIAAGAFVWLVRERDVKSFQAQSEP
jgi:MFS family permease